MKNIIALIGTLYLGTWAISAQQFREYQGKVIDEDSKRELVFASVTLENSNISTITNADGAFTLKVPVETRQGDILVTFLGYEEQRVALTAFGNGPLEIKLRIKRTELSSVEVGAPKNAKELVRAIYKDRMNNYLAKPVRMTAFYRETIRKRNRNVSLSEAVVNVYKAPYHKGNEDIVTLYKSRKNTDYNKLDTLALKLQGGPYNALLVDLVKYPEYIFSGELLDQYSFFFDRFTTLGDRELQVIKFKPVDNADLVLYEGELYLDLKKNVITNARFSLRIEDDPIEAASLFVRKKPMGVDVTPEMVSYWVDYKNTGDSWYYSYSNSQLTFKVDWKGKLFNSVYTMYSEMAVTDWEEVAESDIPQRSERVRRSIILEDEASGFADPEFWGPYNIIEPEKSIESAIRKIQRQIKRGAIDIGTAQTGVPEVIIGTKVD